MSHTSRDDCPSCDYRAHSRLVVFRLRASPSVLFKTQLVLLKVCDPRDRHGSSTVLLRTFSREI